MRPIVLLAILLLLAGSASGADPRLIVVPQPIPPLDLAPLQPPSPRSGEFGNPNQSQARTTRETPAEEKRGTDEIPLSTKILPGPDHEAQVKEEQRRADEHASAERGLVYATWYLAAFTLALVIVAGGQIALFFVQLRYIRESLDDAKIAADAARDGAIAARDSADISKITMISRDRAYVHYNGFRWTSHPISGLPDQIFWRIRPRWINSGNTPTRNMSVHVDYELRDTALPDDFVFSYEQSSIPAMIPPHGSIESAFRDISAEDLAMVRDGRKFFYAWGTATYRDVFPDTPDRITRFCVFVLNVTGDPFKGWHEQNNPLEIIFAFFSRHNCADEDCDRDYAT